MRTFSQIKDMIMNYDYSALLSGVKNYAKKIGRAASKPLVLVWLVFNSPTTPKSDKLWIGGALAYLVLPLDIISARRIPILGLVDEALAVGVIYKKVKKHVTPQMELEAEQILDRWFGPANANTVLQAIPVDND